MTVAYRHRKTDAAFRAAWLDAIAIAYQRLELVLLAGAEWIHRLAVARGGVGSPWSEHRSEMRERSWSKQ